MASDLNNEEIILPLPGEEELIRLRKEHIKRKLPTLDPNQHADNTKIGWFKTTDTPTGMIVEWQMINCDEHSEKFHKLESIPQLAHLRLEFGWLMANLWKVEGLRLLWAIPDPNVGMKESSRYFTEEARWRGWAVSVPFKRENIK